MEFYNFLAQSGDLPLPCKRRGLFTPFDSESELHIWCYEFVEYFACSRLNQKRYSSKRNKKKEWRIKHTISQIEMLK